MNKALLIFVLIFLAMSAVGQRPQRPGGPPTSKTKSPGKAPAKPEAQPEPTPPTEVPDADRQRYEAALTAPTTAEKANLLKAFVGEFPESELRDEAYSYLITARTVVGNELIQAGDVAAGIASYKLAVAEAPTPIPDRMFSDLILKIPGTLFYGSRRAEAMELASLIEKKVAESPNQLLGVAAFYLGVENGAEAKRLAEFVIANHPGSVAAYQTLGLANRLNFDLEEAANAYRKAIELDPASTLAKRGLAEMSRALGKPEAAVALYREMLESNSSDPAARQGLILSLFDAGRQKVAESELAGAMRDEPRNFSLLSSAAYWYAANDQGAQAVEYAQKAIDIEPRYIWSHIVLARGLMKQNKPLDAERALLKARQYGNFPTLDYEIASARFQAGLYREASEELRKSFSVKDGLIGTRLGGRIFKESNNFIELVGYERKASLLEPQSAESRETADKLKLLFELEHKVGRPADEAEVTAIAEEFVAGSDKMKLHRQLYTADLLLRNNVALAKVAELVRASLGNADSGLDVAAPGAAVMASELYESRTIAMARNEVVVIPEVPRQTLSAILRGRIEELAGWTAFQQRDYPEAVVRLRRAISVLPEKSAWWRSSTWRLGAALEADGKDKEALEAYIKSYVADRPSAARYMVIEALYKRVNGNIDGLEEKIGANPGSTIASAGPVQSVPAAPEPTSNDISASVEKAAVVASAAPPAESVPSAVPAKPEAVTSEEKASSEPVTQIVESLPPGSPKSDEAKDASTSDPAVVSKPGADATDKTSNTDVKKETLLEAKPPADKVAERPDPAAPAVETVISEKMPDKQPAAEKDALVPAEKEAADAPKEPTADPAASELRSAPEPVTMRDPSVTVQNAPLKERPISPPASGEETKVVVKSDTAPPEAGPAITSGSAEKAEAAVTEPVNLLRDPFAGTVTSPEKSAEKPPVKTLIIVNDPFKTDVRPVPVEARPSKPKQLFEPVIISVPGTGQLQSPRPAPENDPVNMRARVVQGKDIVSDQSCRLEVSQQSIMLLSGGGSLGILVRVEGEGSIAGVTGSSGSPGDIEVRPEPMIEGVSGRRFFVIKSLSENTGIFRVNFQSPCGKREVEVHVR